LKSRLGSTAFRSIDAAQLKRNTLGGIQLERGLVH
jgi:hypothetical protein